MSDFVLAKIDVARAALAEAKTVQEAKQIADVAEAARIYAKRVEASVETVNYAAEIKIRAERLLGEMLAQTPKNAGARGIGTSVVVNADRTPKLRDIRISKDQSSRSQKLAKIPAPKFEHAIADQKRSGELTTTGLLRAAAPAPSSKIIRYRPANGLKYSAMAIANLNKIQPNDLERDQAFGEVEAYIAKQRTKGTPAYASAKN